MLKKPLVFIIVLNWNGYKDTIECLKSIKLLNVKNFRLKVVIVDNASSDNSVEQIRKFVIHDSKFIVLVNKANLGFAAGNNVGIKKALEQKADYVMVLNNDTILHSDSMIQIIKALVKDPNIGLVSPKIYFAKNFEFHKTKYKKEDKGRVIWYAGGVIDWDNVYGTTRGVDEVDRGQFDKDEETDFSTGACMVLTRKLLGKVGMFDEKYYMYYEDTDLSVRAKKIGFEVMYVPSSILWHKVAQSSSIGGDLNDYFITRNRLLFGLKYAPLRTKGALIRESIKLLLTGRKWQRIGVIDFYLGRFGKGSWK